MYQVKILIARSVSTPTFTPAHTKSFIFEGAASPSANSLFSKQGSVLEPAQLYPSTLTQDLYARLYQD